MATPELTCSSRGAQHASCTPGPNFQTRSKAIDPEAPVKGASTKLQVYQALQDLNQGFEQVLIDLQRLRGLGFRTEFLTACRVVVEETRAWANVEIIEALQFREQGDWERFSRLRHATERKRADPQDALIEADRLRRRTQGSGASKRGERTDKRRK
jgi:hypothetical protein